MGDDSEHPRSKDGWVEVEGKPGEPHTAFCPRAEKEMPLHECLGCRRYHTLALDPTGKHVYLDCDWVGAEDLRKPEE